MIRSLYTAATGMKANQLYVDNISHNLSNVNTVGFKKSKIEFEDLIYQNLIEPGGENNDGAKRPTGLQIGLGVRSISNKKLFLQGAPQPTGNKSDLAISGSGFFQVRLPNGEVGYTRNGSFTVTDEGFLATSSGYLLEPPINIPSEATDGFQVSETGIVTASLGEGEVPEEVGQIELARFINASGLKAEGGNLFTISEASGPPIVSHPGENNMGIVMQQHLEASNVVLVEEMVNMIVAQRAYEISSKSIQASDDMLSQANQLKR